MPTLTTRWPEDDLRQLLCQDHFRDADGWSGNRPTEGSCNHEGTSAWATFRPCGHAGVMLTALLALFLLLTVAWALHDSNAALERQNQFKQLE